MDITSSTRGDFTPTAYTIPPHESAHGSQIAASIVVNLVGMEYAAGIPQAQVDLSVEEAEHLRDLLTETIANVRAGRFSRDGYLITHKPVPDDATD